MSQDDLLNSYNEAFQKGKLSVSWRRGIISLIPKEDNDLSLLTSWRPIALLNVDYKILAKTIAKRIEPFLPKLIHSDIGVRAFFCQVGAVNHLPKKFLQVAQILRNSRKETRVIPCTNNGLHMK